MAVYEYHVSYMTPYRNGRTPKALFIKRDGDKTKFYLVLEDGTHKVLDFYEKGSQWVFRGYLKEKTFNEMLFAEIL